jgi:hypothetical protein
VVSRCTGLVVFGIRALSLAVPIGHIVTHISPQLDTARRS